MSSRPEGVATKTMTHVPPWVLVGAMLLCAGWGSNQFVPMIVLYHQSLGLSTGTLEAMFGFYALGLVPGLLLAGTASDSRGRRPVVIAAALCGLCGSVALVGGGHMTALLFLGRFLIGLSSDAAFSAGTVWLRELSLLPGDGATSQVVARHAVVTMTTGFALGPVVSGALAQWAPFPLIRRRDVAGDAAEATASLPVVEGVQRLELLRQLPTL